MSRAALLTTAIPVLLVGGLFTGQGVGLIPGSFMTGSTFWAIVGIVLLLGGAWAVVFAIRRG